MALAGHPRPMKMSIFTPAKALRSLLCKRARGGPLLRSSCVASAGNGVPVVGYRIAAPRSASGFVSKPGLTPGFVRRRSHKPYRQATNAGFTRAPASEKP